MAHDGTHRVASGGDARDAVGVGGPDGTGGLADTIVDLGRPRRTLGGTVAGPRSTAESAGDAGVARMGAIAAARSRRARRGGARRVTARRRCSTRNWFDAVPSRRVDLRRARRRSRVSSRAAHACTTQPPEHAHVVTIARHDVIAPNGWWRTWGERLDAAARPGRVRCAILFSPRPHCARRSSSRRPTGCTRSGRRCRGRSACASRATRRSDARRAPRSCDLPELGAPAPTICSSVLAPSSAAPTAAAAVPTRWRRGAGAAVLPGQRHDLRRAPLSPRGARPVRHARQQRSATRCSRCSSSVRRARDRRPRRAVTGESLTQAALALSSSRLRVRLGSTGMPGPIVVAKVTFLRYRPFDDDGLARSTSSSAAA